MRLFIRVETFYVVTIDIPDSSSILDLKHALWDSKQTKIDIAEMCLYKLCDELQDDSLIMDVMQIDGVKFPYIVLLKHRNGESPILKSGIVPNNNAGNVALNAQLSIPLSQHILSVKKDFVELRTSKDQKCEGETIMLDDDGKPILQFKPLHALNSNTVYMVYVQGEHVDSANNTTTVFGNELWRFSTLSLISIRLLVTEKNTNTTKYVTLERDCFDLVTELRCKTAARFGVKLPHHCQTFSCGDKGIYNNYDILYGDAIHFIIDTSFTPEIPEESGPKLTFEEYKAQHWVNEEAGFYALVGKMTKEEENSALEEIYKAFVVNGNID